MYFLDTNSVRLFLCAFIEGYTEGSQDRAHGKVGSTHVYMHKCAEERRIARRSDRTRCTQYLKDVGSKLELVRKYNGNSRPQTR